MSFPHTIGNDALICHAYNKDYTQMAVSINTPDIFILDVPQSPNDKFVLRDTLKKHSLLVTSLDWSKKNNVLLSGSADREAYVWVQQPDGKWKATLTVLQNNRAVTSVLWSPLENKFAAGTGSKCVSISNYQAEFDIWSSKHLKKSIKSTVTCIDWHPNNVLLAVGSTDFRVRVFSAFLEKIDPNPEPTNWGSKMNFGSVLYETQTQKAGWIHDVKFSDDGTKLAFASHNSSISIIDATTSDVNLITYKHNNLPFLSLVWVSNKTILCAGHDCSPILYYYEPSEGKITQGSMLDQKSDQKAGGKLTAMKKFQDIDRMATTQENVGSKLSTVHQNSIRQILALKKSSKYSTIGLDGQLVMWDFDVLSKQISDLRL